VVASEDALNSSPSTGKKKKFVKATRDRSCRRVWPSESWRLLWCTCKKDAVIMRATKRCAMTAAGWLNCEEEALSRAKARNSHGSGQRKSGPKISFY
jgi:hypothetical protein